MGGGIDRGFLGFLMCGTSLGGQPTLGGRGTLLDWGTCGCGLSQDHVAPDEPFLPSPYPIQISNLPNLSVCVPEVGLAAVWQYPCTAHVGALVTQCVPSLSVPSPAGAVLGRALAPLRCSQAASRCTWDTLDIMGGEGQLLLV